jgi:hypothetical protein
MLQKIETRQGDIRFPAYGRLDEIHKVLTEILGWTGLTVTINGWGYTVTPRGFIDNTSLHNSGNKIPAYFSQLHPGMAILVGLIIEEGESPLCHYQIITTARVPHIIDRCLHCGDPLVTSERKHKLCDRCYGEITK